MTRDEEDSDARRRPLDPAGRRALLQDLESIRTLLEDLERDASGIDLTPPTPDRAPGAHKPDSAIVGRPTDDDPAAHIPVLREVVRPAPARADESRERRPAAAAPATSPTASTAPAAALARASDGSPDAAPGPERPESQGELFDPRVFADRLLNDDWRRERDAILEAARRSARTFDAPAAEAPAAPLHAGADALRERLAAALAPRVDALLDESLAQLREALSGTLHAELRRLLEAPGGPDNDTATRNPDAPSDTAAQAADRDPDETD